jgi:Fic/DOC family protein
LVPPALDPLSPVVVRAKALGQLSLRACPSGRASLDRFFAVADGEGSASCYPGLHDPLGGYVSYAGEGGKPARTLAEFAAWQALGEPAGTMLANGPDGLTHLLLAVHRRLGAGASAFRDRPVATRPDGAGKRALYPHHRHVPRLIDEVHDFVRTNLVENPALCAAFGYVGITQAHPFSDGNGRTARALYNLVLAAGGARHFLPISAFPAPARIGLVIKVRRTAYEGDWAPLIAWFADATRLSDRLQRAPSPAARG